MINDIATPIIWVSLIYVYLYRRSL